MQARVRGAILGLAVGDALGLPAEGLSRDAIQRLGWNRWRHRLIFGRGMLSDDTEHALYTARCLMTSGRDPNRFARCLAWRLRWWLVALPAGIGMATGRAIFKLWMGFPPHKSGVWSAGNGPAMRSPIIGAACGGDPALMAEMVEASTRITHTDPKAQTGAMAVARATAFGVSRSTEASDRPSAGEIAGLFESWRTLASEDDEWLGLLSQMQTNLQKGTPVASFAEEIGQGRGVSGYIYHTVPIALYAWLHHFGDFRQTLVAVLGLGGDTDTVGAITGALAAASTGAEAIPPEWLDGIADYPRSSSLIRSSATALADWQQGQDLSLPRYLPIAVFPRNLLFLAIVLFHGFLRLLPIALRRRLIR
jgi:ADP-ribosylglycohydrolase